MTSGDLIERASISAVWCALGGGSLRHGRGVAWWRGGDGQNVSLDEPKGTWFDFARSEGGGILSLIQTALVCDKRWALGWLADHEGVELDDRPPTRSERRQGAQHGRRKEAAGAWRADCIRALRARRNSLWSTEHRVSAWARAHLNNPAAANDLRWKFIWEHALDNQSGDLVKRLLERFERLGTEKLKRLRHHPTLVNILTASLAELNVLRTVLEG